MIAKVSIIVLLAAVASGASLCCEPQQVIPACGVSSGISGLDAGIVGLSAGVSGISSGILSSGLSAGAPVTRNLVANGKYPVALANCGPNADNRVPVTTSHVTAPVKERLVRLPCAIPQPKVISHCCTCYKTIVKPRVHQQIITVPSVQRYIQTTHKPVVENIQYEAVPVNCNSNSGMGVQLVSAGVSDAGVSGLVGSGISGLVGAGSCAPVVPSVSSFAPVVSSVSSCAPVVPTVSSCAPVVSSVSSCAPVVSSVSSCAPVVPSVSSCASVAPALPAFEIPQVQAVAAPAPVSFGCSPCAC